MHRIELLAPAGNFEAFKAAVEAGADAVYLAGNQFGARAYAGNFDRDELTKAVRFAHLRGVAVHVTVNTVVADSELDILADYLTFLDNIKVDAVLVQDLGVAALVKQVAPTLPLHASTQMTVHGIEGVRALEELGFSRVVLSRELSLAEIAYICQHANVEIEVFMHGALCVCYSGQCLMSSMIGARSGNRGRCAQPCRLPYELVDSHNTNVLKDSAGQYLLSPKDLNTIDLLPKLIEAGVSSLKIEGRMKRPEYVAIVVETYRKALDNSECGMRNAELESGESNAESSGGDQLTQDTLLAFNSIEAHRRLAQIFNRDFTTAYLERNQGRDMISDKRPNNRGVLVGRVAKIGANSISIKASETINHGDQLEIWVKVGGRVTITVNDFVLKGDLCTIKLDSSFGVRLTTHSEASNTSIDKIKVHDRVFKVFDAELTAHSRTFFTSADPVRKIPLDITVTARLGQPLQLRFTDDDDTVIDIIGTVDATVALNKPLDEQLLRKQLSRLGNTVFSLRNLSADLDSNIMLPISELNDVRRRAVAALEERRLARFDMRHRIDYANNTADTVNRASSLGVDDSSFCDQSTNSFASQSRKEQPSEAAAKSISESDRPFVLRRHKSSVETKIVVAVDNLNALKIAVDAGAGAILFGGETYTHSTLKPKEYCDAISIAHSAGCSLFVGTPRIVRQAEQAALEAIMAAVCTGNTELTADGIYVHNIATLHLARRLCKIPIHSDYSLIAFNSSTIHTLNTLGVSSVTLSPELTLEQVKGLAENSPLPLECLVHGRLELMISQYCVLGSFIGGIGQHKCSQPCKRGHYTLRDRKAALFPVVTDQFCRMHILNSKPLSMLPHVKTLTDTGITQLRIDGRALSDCELASTIKLYYRTLQGDELSEPDGFDFTRGHYFRGVTASLDKPLVL